MNRDIFSWNPVYNKVMEVKDLYTSTFNKSINNFKESLQELDDEQMNTVFQDLEFTQKDHLLLVRYGVAGFQRGAWTENNGFLLESRSVVIDLLNEELVLTPFSKFFNINEREETSENIIKEKIKHAKLFEVTNKLDGSMQSARYYKGQYIMSGSRALDPVQSYRLQNGYNYLTDGHKQMLKENPDLTFIFENISPDDKHVVEYEEKDFGLHLIGARNIHNGNHLTHQQFSLIAKPYGVKCVELISSSLEELITLMSTSNGLEIEGWVLNIDGQFVKIKTDSYVMLHSAVEDSLSPNMIIRSIYNNTYDDFISKVPPAYRPSVENVASFVFDYIDIVKSSISYWLPKGAKLDKKDFMLWNKQNVPRHIQPFLTKAYLKQDLRILNKRGEGLKKINEIKFFLDAHESQKSLN
ncbi:RNA ligase [Bacillus phage vB_BauM_KLEB27-3]|nr:RNA ligase [Bacillus phage vB_BauM_KLEB27-3]